MLLHAHYLNPSLKLNIESKVSVLILDRDTVLSKQGFRVYLGAEIDRRDSGLLTASSNLRTMTSHFVDLQICLDAFLISSENRVRPAARSTASTE